MDDDPIKEKMLFITVKIWNQYGNEIYMKIKRTVKLQKLMEMYCARIGIPDFQTYRFIVDGNRIHEWQTPEEVGLDDGDQIDAFTELVGG